MWAGVLAFYYFPTAFMKWRKSYRKSICSSFLRSRSFEIAFFSAISLTLFIAEQRLRFPRPFLLRRTSSRSAAAAVLLLFVRHLFSNEKLNNVKHLFWYIDVNCVQCTYFRCYSRKENFHIRKLYRSWLFSFHFFLFPILPFESRRIFHRSSIPKNCSFNHHKSEPT